MTFQTNFTLLLKTQFIFSKVILLCKKASVCVSAVVYLSDILINAQKALDIAKHLRYRHLQMCFLVRFSCIV